MGRYSPAERIGVAAVQTVVEKGLGWLFREQPISDFGIDAHVETVFNGNPTGKLIAVQIKSGPSHFQESGKTYTYYIDKVHYEYWANHSLPVILVAVPSEDTIIWQKLTRSTMKETSKGYKVLIPKSQSLTEDAKRVLVDLAEGPKEVQKVRKLILDRPIVRHLQTGGAIYVEFDDWVNKSLGRSEIKLFFDEKQKYVWHHMFTGYSALGLIENLFPWAGLSLDQEFYDMHCDYGGEELYLVKRQYGEIYPYAEEMGEVVYYRVELSLNALGKGLEMFYDFIDS